MLMNRTFKFSQCHWILHECTPRSRKMVKGNVAESNLNSHDQMTFPESNRTEVNIEQIW